MKTNQSQSKFIPANEGEAFWQPGAVKGNCITIKASPWNIVDAKHTVLMQELPKGAQVSEHAHQEDVEVFICLEGEGIITLDGKEYAFKPHDVAYVTPPTKHSLRGVSVSPVFKFIAIVTPTGLEERLKLMGIPRKSLTEQPPEPFVTDIAKQNTHGVIR